MPKLRYVLAIGCYVAIPVVVMIGVALFVLIDPEMARGHTSYVRAYHLLDMARLGTLWATAGLALGLWFVCCYLLITSRRRSARWLLLSAAGPFGFSVIAALADRSPTRTDLYQRFIGNLPTRARVPFEIGVAFLVWFVAYESVVLKSQLMVYLESVATGTTVSAITAQQTASSGMWAAGEAMEQAYLVPLFYLLWPTLFNIAAWIFKPRALASSQ
jgi:hypothetical protein